MRGGQGRPRRQGRGFAMRLARKWRHLWAGRGGLTSIRGKSYASYASYATGPRRLYSARPAPRPPCLLPSVHGVALRCIGQAPDLCMRKARWNVIQLGKAASELISGPLVTTTVPSLACLRNIKNSFRHYVRRPLYLLFS